MKTSLLSVITIVFLGVVYLARQDLDSLLMVLAIYSLCAYGIVERIEGTLSGRFTETILLRLFLVLAYLILNFFVIRNAIDYLGLHIVYAIAWFLVTSGLMFLKWPIHNNTLKKRRKERAS